MGELLDQVKTICCQLDDNKITTRKKAEEQLTYLLNNNNLLNRLNTVSADRNGREWNWQDVYRCTFNYVKKEVEKIVADMTKDKQTKYAASSRDTKKRTVISLYKLVIRKARKHLLWSSVINDLLNMLDQPFMRSSYSDHVIRLIHDAVIHPVSSSMISVWPCNQWSKILASVLDLVRDPPACLSGPALCQVLHQVLLVGTQAGSLTDQLVKPEIWQCVSGILNSDLGEQAKLECLRAANCLILRVGLDCRQLAVELGEKTIQNVIALWGDMKECAGEVLEFLNYQVGFVMCIHEILCFV